ncbi:DUF3592 domain-containing protein [Streptomyces sp. NPDC058371]|uniref:DUF3592 domain-containing protein n=1 Tax=Streptomyces sp. NPDC058371 TaxID=3346463 RepID=UPI003661FBCB
MDAVFTILMPLIIIGMLWAAYAIVRRTKERQEAWESGLSARARVVRAWVRVQMVNNMPRRIQFHQYDFTTGDGRAVRFEESGGPANRVVGDETVVYYAPDRPDKATASEPQAGKDMALTVIWLILIGVGVVVIINAMVQYG